MARAVKLDRSNRSLVQTGSGIPVLSTPGVIYIDNTTGLLYTRANESSVWQGTGASDHNLLSGLQGGTVSQYYHLTLSDYNTLRGGSSDASSLHHHDGRYLQSVAIDDLTDVDTTGKSNNEVLAYNSGSGNWEPLAYSLDNAYAGSVSQGDAQIDMATQDIRLRFTSANIAFWIRSNSYLQSFKIASDVSDNLVFTMTGTGATIDWDVSSIDIDSNSDIYITSNQSSYVESGGSYDIFLNARGSSITVNQAGDIGLSGFTATSIIGALNELKTDAVTELNDLTDVVITSPGTGDLLVYNTVSGDWENTGTVNLSTTDIRFRLTTDTYDFNVTNSAGNQYFQVTTDASDNTTFKIGTTSGTTLFDIDVTTLSFDISDNAGIGAGGDMYLMAGSISDMQFTARGSSIVLNESGSTALVGYTATSIIGALNEVKVDATNVTLDEAYNNGSTITVDLSGGNLDLLVTDGGSDKIHFANTNATDYIDIECGTSNQLTYNALLQTYSIATAGNFSVSASGNSILAGVINSVTATDTLNITLTANSSIIDKSIVLSATNSGSNDALITLTADNITATSTSGNYIEINDSSGNLKIFSTVSANIELDPTADLVITASNLSGTITTDCSIDSATLSLDSTDSTNISMTVNSTFDKTFSIDATNSGSGSGILDIDADDLDIDSGSVIDITATTSINISSSSFDDITLASRGGSITVSQSGDVSLDSSFAATSIIGALNEVKSGLLNFNVTTVNAATYSTVTTDRILDVTYTSTGTVTITLDTDTAVSGKMITITDTGLNATTNNITVNTEGSEQIMGDSDLTIDSDGSSITLWCDGTDWWLM